MAQSIEESLLQAIKNDDTKAFNVLMEKAPCGAYRMGRFPVLSLLYLYKSRKILSEYEECFLEISSFEALREPVEVSRKFSVKAGKCLRLYLNEVVSPAEMLLILDRTKHLKRIFPRTKPSEEVKGRLKSIYSIKYSLNVRFKGDDIIIDRRPLSYREKKNIASICLCSVLAVTLAVGVPVTTISLIPKPVEGEVTKLSQIDFSSTNEYTLKKDLVLPENYTVKKTKCKINGNGNKIIFNKGAKLGDFNGKISDLIIESSGYAIFDSIHENATIENVTVNVNAAVTVTEETALIAATNYGTIDGITVNVSGKMTALAGNNDGTNGLSFGGIVQNNNYIYSSATQKVYQGIIKNCTVNYSRFELIGEASANAAFGGVAGINNGYLQDCSVTGEIIADTFDIAGVCIINNGLLSGNVNETNLSQTSTDTGWNPISCGIVLSNTYAVENCENRGSISAVSNCGRFEVQAGYEPTASAAGIAYLNRSSTTTPYIKNCTNSGNVESSAAYRNVYAAGICLSSSGGIESCNNDGAVTVKADNAFSTYGGGITAVTYGNIYNSINGGALSLSGNGSAYAGGISALSNAQIAGCFSGGDIKVTAQNVCAGGILGYSEVTQYLFYVYCGTVDYCISESKIKVTIIDDKPAFIGGIAGYVSEAGFNSNGSLTYFGGYVTNCYFTGECVSAVSYFGNIVGVCGANIYENNLYSSGINEYHNFDGNYYLNNSLNAFGATVSSDETFSLADENKGATSATIEEIQNSETYKSILNSIKN